MLWCDVLLKFKEQPKIFLLIKKNDFLYKTVVNDIRF